MPRKFTRLHVPLEILVESSSGNREARISDLSMGGCFVESILTVTDGETTGFEIRLSPNESMKVSGKIVYSMPSIGFGIKFDELTDEQKFHLEHLILKNGGTTKEISE